MKYFTELNEADKTIALNFANMTLRQHLKEGAFIEIPNALSELEIVEITLLAANAAVYTIEDGQLQIHF